MFPVLMVQPLDARVSSYGILITGIDHTTPRNMLAAHLQTARDAGAGWVRIDFMWYSAEWNPGQLDWRHFDRVIDEAVSRGLVVIPILWGTPGWAVAYGGFSYGVPDMAAWERFVFAVASRYRGRIPMWEVWNEPDLAFYWRGTSAQYADLLARAHGQIKRADPNASVLLGGLAQGGGAVSSFLADILSDPVNPAGYSFDVHNIHTNFRYMDWITAQVRDNRAILSRYGFSKTIVVTETSYTANPAYQSLIGYQDGEAGQARYLTDAFRTIVGEGVPLVIWAPLRDSIADHPYAESGLVRTDLSAKAAFEAYRGVAGVFADVPNGYWARAWIDVLAEAGIIEGCARVPRLYCPESPVSRDQMSVFLLKASLGGNYTPPECNAVPFADLPCSSMFARWVADLVARGVTDGCGAGRYCPSGPVTREQMAVFVLRALEGHGFHPPACTNSSFTDVPCSSVYAPWVQELVRRGIAAGCAMGRYCGADPMTRAQMAVLLVKAFRLPGLHPGDSAVMVRGSRPITLVRPPAPATEVATVAKGWRIRYRERERYPRASSISAWPRSPRADSLRLRW
jgi:hypothetical protein